MKKKQLMILALALALPASTLLAQNDGPPQGGRPPGQNGGPPDGGPPDGGPRGPGGPGGPGRGRFRPMPIIAALDTNHDGVISAEEIANAPAALKTLDKNGDGKLTRDELMPGRPPRGGDANGQNDGPPPPPADDANQGGQGRPLRPVPPIIAALDTNGDGVLSADEIANASTSLLKLDKNGDGKLTRDELMPPRPPRNDDGQDGPGNGPPPPPNQN